MAKTRKKYLLLALLAFSSAAVSQEASLKLAAPFTENMILQQSKNVPVWGFDSPGSRVTVEFAGQKLMTTATPAGDWRVDLEPLTASSKGAVFQVSNQKGERIRFQNVLVGEIWFSSGQSNMVWVASKSMCNDLARSLSSSKEEVPIREINIDTVSALYPRKDATSLEGWKTSRKAGEFSALSLAFAHELYKVLNVPVGILLSAHSNTRIEAFTQRQAIEQHTGLKTDRDLILDADPLTEQGENAFERYCGELIKWQEDAGRAALAGGRIPARPKLPGIAGMWRGPSQFFNGKINPLVPFAIRGAIWCQGTSNSGDGRIYADRMEALIRGWRNAWGMPDMPFYFTQMQCYGSPDSDDVGFADIRQAQFRFFMNNRKNVGMVVQSDMNSARPQGIHYFNKLHPGQRLARWALAKQYQRSVPYTGPIYSGYRVKNSQVIVSFEKESLFGGLMVGSKGMARNYREPGQYLEPAQPTPNDSLNHFRLCGADKKWYPAMAKISGTEVVVSSEKVKQPIGVQYAYSSVPENSNLYNRAGLPATPFAAVNGELIFEEDDLEKVAALKAKYAQYTDPDYPILQVVEYLRDGAILQRGQTIPVWGHANQGVEVTVQLGSQVRKTVANQFQQWEVRFSPLEASTQPIVLEVRASHGHQKTVRDILVGDVWYLTGSTQLNGEMANAGLKPDSTPPEKLPWVREFRRKTKASTFPTPRKRKFETGGGRYRSSWLKADFSQPDQGVSMFAYTFAKTLDRKNIPQGFITMSSGQGGRSRQMASPLSWTSFAGVKDIKTPEFRDRLKELFLQYPNTPVAREATREHIRDVRQFVASIRELKNRESDLAKDGPLFAPSFPEAGKNSKVSTDQIPTYSYNWCVSPMTPMAVSGIIWVPNENNIGHAPEHYAQELEIYARSLERTYGVEGVPFLYAQPDQSLVAGIRTPNLPNAKKILFLQWPKSLGEIAEKLALLAK
ncbi:MAG: sialate O-acetylesterase [Planctomycetota bacterium]|nr:sialate O-acetylesterase [Planctomycetota bacterium]